MLVDNLIRANKIKFSEIYFKDDEVIIDNIQFKFTFFKNLSLNNNKIYSLTDNSNNKYILKIIPKKKLTLDNFIEHIILFTKLDEEEISTKFYYGIVSSNTFSYIYEEYNLDLYEYLILLNQKKKKCFINFNLVEDKINNLLDKILNIYNYTDIKLENILVKYDNYYEVIDIKFTDFELYEHVNDNLAIDGKTNGQEIIFYINSIKFTDEEIFYFKYFIKLNLLLSTLNIIKKNKYNINIPLFFHDILRIYQDKDILEQINNFIIKYNDYMPKFFIKYIFYNIIQSKVNIQELIKKYNNKFNFINHTNFYLIFNKLNYLWYIQILIFYDYLDSDLYKMNIDYN